MGKKKKLFIIHFQPLELYPPAMNIIDFLGKEAQLEVRVVSNRLSANNPLSTYSNASVKIHRPASVAHSEFYRYIGYLSFYVSALFLLVWYRPAIVFYFETLSSWPALVYKKLRGKAVQLWVHYHEYIERTSYDQGMVLNRRMHGMECSMYNHFDWISHTNQVRLKMFREDHQLENLRPAVFQVLPNYPAKSWQINKAARAAFGTPKKIVFVGALGAETMYLREVTEWVGKHREQFSLDIYSHNMDDSARELISGLQYDNIRFLGGCDYNSLPARLATFDIGLVIYKPFSQNTIHAVSNKVFEYLACGLDVWFSEDMTYTLGYRRENVYPKLIPVNFRELETFDYQKALSREGLGYQESPFFYEQVYPAILRAVWSHVPGKTDILKQQKLQ